MSYFKFALFFVGFLGFLLGGNSTDNEDQDLDNCLNKLKEKFDIIKNDTYPNGYPIPPELDISAIEIKLGYTLPESLKKLYRAAGNLQFEGFEPADPTGGDRSELYNLIRDCQEKMKVPNKSEWLPFCATNGLVEFFCINVSTGEIRRYVVRDGFEKREAYSNLSHWIKKSWLSENIS